MYLHCSTSVCTVPYITAPSLPLTPSLSLSPPQISGLVWVVLPLRDVVSVEKTHQTPSLPHAMLVTTRSKNTVIFASLENRDELCAKVSNFLGSIAAVTR